MGDLIHPKPQEFTADQVMTDPVLRYFHYAHLPPVLKAVSAPFCDLARMIVEELPRNPERTVALRKLLEAKDAAVRANIPDAPGRSETFFDRLLNESKELDARIEKLDAFMGTLDFAGLADDQRAMLGNQAAAMHTYAEILGQRITSLGSGTASGPVETHSTHVDAGDDAEVRITGGGKSEEPMPFRE